MMKKTKLARTISAVFAGSVISFAMSSEASAHVMYNNYHAYTSNIGTDAGAGGPDGYNNKPDWTPSWSGTADLQAPFGYTGDAANWGAHLQAAGDSLVVSSQNAHDTYGVWADIDTARGAWNDKGPNGPTSGLTSQGWSHNTDIGLFKSSATQLVTLTASSLNTTNVSNFGISVFSGMTTAGHYYHHGGWNINYRPASHSSPNTSPAELDNPLEMVNLDFLTYTDNSTVSFLAQADQVYTILLGGYSGPDVYKPHAGYELSITSAAPVPVPAAVWLFGSALTGLMGMQRRKRQAS